MSEQTYPTKMYASTIVNDIHIYKDKDLTTLWSEDPFKVEFKGKKARVHTNIPFSTHQVSRFNNLKCLGHLATFANGTNNTLYIYQLTVNGYKTFFRTTHNINK